MPSNSLSLPDRTKRMERRSYNKSKRTVCGNSGSQATSEVNKYINKILRNEQKKIISENDNNSIELRQKQRVHANVRVCVGLLVIVRAYYYNGIQNNKQKQCLDLTESIKWFRSKLIVHTWTHQTSNHMIVCYQKRICVDRLWWKKKISDVGFCFVVILKN